MTYNFSPPIHFCPHCGGPIGTRFVGGEDRPFCATCRATFYQDPKLAVAVLVDNDGRLVFQQRKIDPGKGKWTFPSGYVERCERIEDAAVREVREETGLEVRLTNLLGLFSHTGNPVALAVYTADPIGGTITVSEESHQVAYFSPAELPDLAFEHDSEIVATWLARRKTR